MDHAIRHQLLNQRKDGMHMLRDAVAAFAGLIGLSSLQWCGPTPRQARRNDAEAFCKIIYLPAPVAIIAKRPMNQHDCFTMASLDIAHIDAFDVAVLFRERR